MTLLPDVRAKWKISCQQHINFWLSIMSGHVANPVFFNKKNKDWMSRTLTSPPPLRPITSHFCLTPIPLPESGHHMCITTN